MRIAVKDNGVGFDSTVQRAATHGLLGMRYRVEAEGGSMRLESKPGQGTLIEAVLPVIDIDDRLRRRPDAGAPEAHPGMSAYPCSLPRDACRPRPTSVGLLPRQGRARVPYRPRTACHGHCSCY